MGQYSSWKNTTDKEILRNEQKSNKSVKSVMSLKNKQTNKYTKKQPLFVNIKLQFIKNMTPSYNDVP